ncbi:MAG: O-antigen polymerase [Candidatus Magasanikbacteria bacterium GW2011_GWC2_37_14]|uniref:O-antigen polymerase n=1 Tax=Candidatus Magasanikbacteria bacterium GW2011_GWC2_37_14 TaxID=1619046 RepID=A0A0G0IUH5_9BACT|nr:MAG: O-antigen polymerase [Candidatus Magasanikbacteria bacterium GW2011_GWC2_37_14]
MLFYSVLIVYSILFTFLTWKNFTNGLFLFFLLLPTYLIRLNLGSLPTTLLEIMFWIILIVWLIKSKSKYQIADNINQNKILFAGITLFLISATISIFTSSNLRAALGEWKAFYVEPILIFIILITTFKKIPHKIIYALIVSGLVTALLSIYQHFTGWQVPYAFWQNHNTFRVTAWYGFPNGVGLFLAPIVPFIIYFIIQEWQKLKQKNWLLITSYLLSAICYLSAIIFSKGTGPLLGVLAGSGFLLLVYKKTRWPIIIIGIVGIVSLVSLASLSKIKQEIFFGDRSGQIRLVMWQDTLNFLKDHPLAGAGLTSYSQKIVPYHSQVNGENIEIFHHPHNIFLTMYVNLGLLGLVSFLLIIFWFFKTVMSNIKYQITDNSETVQQCNNVTIYLISSMIIILVMGLVDSPYIKNDLAILFWLLPALLLITKNYELEK